MALDNIFSHFIRLPTYIVSLTAPLEQLIGNAMTRLATPALRTFQSLWAMEDLPTAAAPWTLEEQIGLLVEAGYAGVAVDLGARRAPTPRT